jgi:hypothetical protein
LSHVSESAWRWRACALNVARSHHIYAVRCWRAREAWGCLLSWLAMAAALFSEEAFIAG